MWIKDPDPDLPQKPHAAWFNVDSKKKVSSDLLDMEFDEYDKSAIQKSVIPPNEPPRNITKPSFWPKVQPVKQQEIENPFLNYNEVEQKSISNVIPMQPTQPPQPASAPLDLIQA